MNLEFICKQAHLHSQGLCNGDECLYRIGFAAGLLTEADITQVKTDYLGCHLRGACIDLAVP